MSFDIDPQDQYKRILCYHAESDAVFEVFSLAEFGHCCQHDAVDDVTDIDRFEVRFREEKDE